MSPCRNVIFGLMAALLYAHVGATQYSANMFLNGQYKDGVKSQPQHHFAVNPAGNVFLEHAVFSRQAKPFSGPTYLPPKELLKCANGQQCVRQGQCQNGYYSQQQPKIQNCQPDTDVCCTYRAPPTTTTTTARPFVTCGRDSDCVPARDCRNGEISAPNYVKKQSSNRCYAPEEVCCRMPSTTLTDDGYIFNVPETKFPLPTYPTTQAVYRPQPTVPPTVYRPQPTQPTRKPINEYLPPQTTPARVRPTSPPLYRPTQPEYRPTQSPATYRPTQPAYRPTQPPQPTYRPTQPTYRPTQPAYRPPVTKPNQYLPPVSTNDVDYREPQPSNQKPIRGEDQLSPQIFPERRPGNIPKTYAKCASALLCTDENFCNAIGVISETPVNLSPAESAFRVPLTDCQIPSSGAPGKCCRDSNYVDPWPVNLAGVCASRNKNTKPTGIKDIDSNFAEIPWQAMILKESTKSLLCGGAIIGDEFVLTTADCVQGVSPSDVRIKAGEWELGSTTEPLPFQLVGAKTIDTHPQYNPSSGANNMAIIRLEKRLEFATHIQPICISDEDPSPTERCVTTGWGKQALSIHEEGAIMHVTTTSTKTRSDCGADASNVCSATNFDACEFDSGSALACGSGSGLRLKGVYSAENGCGEGQTVRFTKPDVKWINTAFAAKNKPLLLRRF